MAAGNGKQRKPKANKPMKMVKATKKKPVKKTKKYA